MKRLPILYVILAVLVLVSVAPLLVYGIKVIAISREALETNEKELQNTIARSVADDLNSYHAGVLQQMETLARTVAPGGNAAANDPAHVSKALEDFVAAVPNVLYVTMVNEQARGLKAGRYNAENDPFLLKTLERAFAASQQGQPFQSEPVLVQRGGKNVVVAVVSLPVTNAGQFRGMIAGIVDLEPMVERLQQYSIRGLVAFAVNESGRLMLHPDLEHHTIGEDETKLGIVARFLSWKSGEAQARETTSYDVVTGKTQQHTPMLGTYCSVPSLRWAVITQKPQAIAYASVFEIQKAMILWGVVLLLASLIIAYVSALRITTPIQVLTESSRAIARGDFSRRIELKNRTEIGELAATFNHMTGELERYIEQLKRAAEENHELFVSSIRMIAAAVDEKDPYTRGHSERVTRYSLLIGQEMALPEEEIYRLKIAGLLHDVGKIGIEDRVLKKPGALTAEEFEVMKTHTTRGANILRPIDKLRDVIPGVELHHESLDGHGYPWGLKGDQIPLIARIISVADTFDAMTTNRPYQAAMEPEIALRYIQSQTKRRYDPKCVDALQRALENGKLRMTRTALVV